MGNERKLFCCSVEKVLIFAKYPSRRIGGYYSLLTVLITIATPHSFCFHLVYEMQFDWMLWSLRAHDVNTGLRFRQTPKNEV